MSERLIKGFDYRGPGVGRTVELPREEWDAMTKRVEDAGGWHKYIGGDRSVFAANGRMQFEIYDYSGQAQ